MFSCSNTPEGLSSIFLPISNTDWNFRLWAIFCLSYTLNIAALVFLSNSSHKNWDSVIIYSISCHSEPICCCILHSDQVKTCTILQICVKELCKEKIHMHMWHKMRWFLIGKPSLNLSRSRSHILFDKLKQTLLWLMSMLCIWHTSSIKIIFWVQ